MASSTSVISRTPNTRPAKSLLNSSTTTAKNTLIRHGSYTSTSSEQTISAHSCYKNTGHSGKTTHDSQNSSTNVNTATFHPSTCSTLRPYSTGTKHWTTIYSQFHTPSPISKISKPQKPQMTNKITSTIPEPEHLCQQKPTLHPPLKNHHQNPLKSNHRFYNSAEISSSDTPSRENIQIVFNHRTHLEPSRNGFHTSKRHATNLA